MTERWRWTALALGTVVTCMVLFSGLEECPPSRCEMVSWGGHDYLFCYQPGVERDWTNARDACRALTPPMDLVAINSQEEQDFIDAVWREIRLDATPVENHVGNPEYVAYIGLNDIAAEDQWAWSNGDPVDYVNWCSGEPNNAGNEDCVVTGWSADYENGPGCPDLGWNDIPCDVAVAYICEQTD